MRKGEGKLRGSSKRLSNRKLFNNRNNNRRIKLIIITNKWKNNRIMSLSLSKFKKKRRLTGMKPPSLVNLPIRSRKVSST